MQYRKAEKKDLEEIVQVASTAFEEYLFVKVIKDVMRDQHQYPDFVKSMMRILVKVFLKHHICLVAEKDGEIYAVALLQKGPIPFRAYLLNGGLGLLKYISLKNMLAYFAFMENTDKELEKNADFDWYLMLLGVAPNHQRQGYGSRFMTEGIEPFLKSIKGETLAFYTNTKGNVYFYTKNGYKEVYESTIHFNNVKMGSWYFLKEMKNP